MATIGGLALLIVFMVQNTERVAVSLLFWDLDWPVWLMVLGAALLGAVVLYGLGVVRRHRQRKRVTEGQGAGEFEPGETRVTSQPDRAQQVRSRALRTVRLRRAAFRRRESLIEAIEELGKYDDAAPRHF